MNVLFVAFEFPPMASSGVHRSLRFAKYLREFGITPIVITPDLDTLENSFDLDEGLLLDAPPDLIIERVVCQPLPKSQSGFGAWKNIFFSLSDQLGKLWRPELERRLPELIEKYRPEAIYVSLPPFSMAPLWSDLAQTHGLPLVLDFRDLWAMWCSTPNQTRLHFLLKKSLERRCLQAATRVICATAGVRDDLLELHPRLNGQKFVTITNGYDAAVCDWSLLPSPRGASEEFVIGYVGSFYYTPQARAGLMLPWWRRKPTRMLQYTPRLEDWLYRSPYFFFRAVAALLAQRPELRPRLKIRFAGSKPSWIDAQVQEFGLSENVEFVGRLNHKACLDFQSQCDALLLTSAKVLGGRDYCISSKTFEYFMTHKPILGLVTQGTQKDILERSGMAVVCDPDATEQAALKIGELVDGQVHYQPDSAFLNTFHRRERTRELAQVFRSLQTETSSAHP